MRIRILKPLSGVVDRVFLSHLTPGLMYDVEEGLARYLISCGAAEESASSRPALVIAFDDPYLAHLTGGITVSHVDPPPSDVADDKPAKVRRRKRKRRAN